MCLNSIPSISSYIGLRCAQGKRRKTKMSKQQKKVSFTQFTYINITEGRLGNREGMKKDDSIQITLEY